MKIFCYNFVAIAIIHFNKLAYTNSINNHFIYDEDKIGEQYNETTATENLQTPSSISSPANEAIVNKLRISEHDLATFLFRNYSADCRPRRNASESVAVRLGITLYALNEIVERTHEIILTASLIVLWVDEFLKWDNSPPYSQIKLIPLPSKRIWLPDIALTNSGDLYSFMHSRGMMAVIRSNGAVEYFPEATVKAFCQFDLTYFPFDQQMCEFRLESWSYIISQQTLQLIDEPVNIDRFSVNEQWQLVGSNATSYTDCYNYSYVTSAAMCYPGTVFQLSLRRKSGYYVIMIIIPSIIFSAVELVAFSLPLVEVSKIQITFTCLLSYTVFQTTVQSDLPRTSEHDPLLSIYIDLQMAFIAFALLGEAFVFLSLQQAFKTKKAPKFLLKLLFISTPKQTSTETTPSNRPIFLQQQQIIRPTRITLTTTANHSSTPNLASPINDLFVQPSNNMQPNGDVEQQELLETNNFSSLIRRYPSRDVLTREMTTSLRNYRHNDDSDDCAPSAINNNNNHRPLSRVERLYWELIASRVESLVIAVYTAAIIFTPIFMFYLSRMIE